MSENSSSIIYIFMALGLGFLAKGLMAARAKGGAIDSLKQKIQEDATFMGMERDVFLTRLEEEPDSFETSELVKHLILVIKSLSDVEQKQITHILNQLNETGQRVFIKSIVE